MIKTDDALIQILISFFNTHKRNPTNKDINPHVYINRFGSWSNAMKKAGLAKCKVEKVKNSCLYCGKSTNNNKFCSSSCAAIYNNTKTPKIKRKIYWCKRCGGEARRKRLLCPSCLNYFKIDYSSLTIGEFQDKEKYQISSRIRSLCREWFPYTGKCSVCGYSKHTELHHIKQINSFPPPIPL